MMKKPLNSAIRPIPPYGELAPWCGTSCSPTPKTSAQPMNRNPNRNFAFGLVTLRTQREPPSAVIAEREDDRDHRDDDDGRDPERDRLLEGDQEELHAAMLADGPARRPNASRMRATARRTTVAFECPSSRRDRGRSAT